MIYNKPTTDSSILKLQSHYQNFIDGKWTTPIDGRYFDNTSPIDGKVYCQVAKSNNKDVELALDAAHKAKNTWHKTSVTERSNLLLKLADIIDANTELLALAETWDNGKPIRESLGADIPLAADHFRYFAGCIRAQEGGISEIDENTVAYHFHEPLGVVGQIIPWNFPFLMAIWKFAPALAAGNCIVIKPASQTPLSISIFMDLVKDIIPAGVVNIVHGLGSEAGEALASSNRINKIAFTGSTAVGQKIMEHATKNLIPVSLELGGKSPNVFFEDIMSQSDEFIDKAVEGFLLGFFNQGEVCTCPSRILIQESIYNVFMEKVINRTKLIKQGNPLDTETMLGALASKQQLDTVLSYTAIAQTDGASCLIGGKRNINGALADGFYVEPTIYKGTNDMRIFQEEIFGPMLVVTTFKDEAEAIAIANDTSYGLGAGIWTMDVNLSHRVARAIQAGRVWTNCYHLYPAHAAFGGYKKSGFGRETHKVALEHYQQIKNVLSSYSTKALGFF